ncbi:hypothetical protein UFOVP964_6 [uncultured Caudovirales phage]|uniref:Uncharacterized protein n=1 Tax=uncultured Caudovirales phage TaxID=2100421 RepID=A0A6J5PXA9_9CAUD|nr:hypothetical protein UFOVP854_6 [uncultured Caudovirales phage]CAB4173698.1 hypothetical protein UFOVP964_6 [uncultured Caudovirales phage]CAB4179566.1 hypothetical protein UFOVP1034_152 [uncultured Caudovirales phage]CAB4189196.1 hypothetical protein UFOVP1177_152 [uncultured Caudovirales phage]CAB4193731.1 hypothetical protein UFOVP1243_139 [uncultured Caudovirales phage]
MATYAVLSGNQVSNIIVAETIEDASVVGTVVEYTIENPAGIGWSYDEATGTFLPPITVET